MLLCTDVLCLICVFQNGVYSSIPHIAKVIAAVLSGGLVDCLLLRKVLNTTNVRKLFTGIGTASRHFLLPSTSSVITMLLLLSVLCSVSVLLRYAPSRICLSLPHFYVSLELYIQRKITKMTYVTI